MTSNIYDDENFFKGYSQLDRSVKGLDGAPEWETMRSMLPDLNGADLLDLGCGFGWFCRFARQSGAASVHGIDVSEKMLSRAKADTKDAGIAYFKTDLESVELRPNRYDAAYSSLVFHYIADLRGLLAKIYASLKPEGRLVCSVEHPIYTASAAPQWIRHPAGFRTWPVDGYQREEARTTNWLAEGFTKQHRTFGTYINLLVGTGFTIERVVDWAPSAGQLAEHPEWEEELDRPMFLLMSARRLSD
ncbi:class I SAM-dependent methyltransferase [Paenibacillus humicola]|uniref:class I SAM-dependent methyltransferase n=1 Tax=Paenibacillus humicola TaxID=3110540 RepID=UPI00237A3741|nr:class I SAM-dependent methyltransferase [Paenibacillus humicola]